MSAANTTSAIIIGGVTASTISMLAGVILGANREADFVGNNKPYIGCDFSDRREAETQRSFGVLDKKAVSEACQKAVDNYFEKGLTSENGKVVITVPSREMIVGSKQLGSSVTPTP
jgi:hypothetical protein